MRTSAKLDWRGAFLLPNVLSYSALLLPYVVVGNVTNDMLYDVTMDTMKRSEMSQVTSDCGPVRGVRLCVPRTRGGALMATGVIGQIMTPP